jgi:hypothetical protein
VLARPLHRRYVSKGGKWAFCKMTSALCGEDMEPGDPAGPLMAYSGVRVAGKGIEAWKRAPKAHEPRP